MCIYIYFIYAYTEFDMISGSIDWGSLAGGALTAGISREQNSTNLRQPAVSSVRLVALSGKGHRWVATQCAD